MSELDFILSWALSSQQATIKWAQPSLWCHQGPVGTTVPHLVLRCPLALRRSRRRAVGDTALASGLEGCREWGGENPSTACPCGVLGAGLLLQLEMDIHGLMCGTQPICHTIWSFQEMTRPGRVTANRATKAWLYP